MKRLTVFIIIYIVFGIISYSQTVKIKLIKKIDTETSDYIITPSMDIIKMDEHSIYVLSVKERKFFVLSKDGEYQYGLFRKGEGPCELKYPYDFYLLPNKKVIIFNSSREFKILNLKVKNCFVKKVVHDIYMPMQIELVGKNNYLVLKSIPVAIGDEESNKYLLYFYDIKKNKIIDMFYKLNIKDESKLKYLRGELGKGNFVINKKKIFLVFNQPGYMKVFSINGKLLTKIKTEFPFIKKNKASVVNIRQGDYIITRIKSDEKCKMRLIKANNKVYLIVRNNDLKQSKVEFYCGEVDIKKKIVKNFIKFDFGNIKEKILYYKSYYRNLLIFGNDNYIYIYSLLFN